MKDPGRIYRIEAGGCRANFDRICTKDLVGLFLRNQVIRACAISGLAELTFGRNIIGKLHLLDYCWPALVLAQLSFYPATPEKLYIRLSVSKCRRYQ